MKKSRTPCMHTQLTHNCMEHETLTVIQLYSVEKCPVLYGTRKFITMGPPMFLTLGCTFFTKIRKRPPNSTRQNAEKKQVPYWRPTNLWHHRTKSSRHCDLAPGICAPLYLPLIQSFLRRITLRPILISAPSHHCLAIFFSAFIKLCNHYHISPTRLWLA
jgi:hypothetical protein